MGAGGTPGCTWQRRRKRSIGEALTLALQNAIRKNDEKRSTRKPSGRPARNEAVAPPDLVASRASSASEPRERSAPAKRRARERVGESEGRSPSVKVMLFAKQLREGIRRGRIRCSVRVWTNPHVKVGGRYRMDDGHIVVDSIAEIIAADITADLARGVRVRKRARSLAHRAAWQGRQHLPCRFHYVRRGAWDTPEWRRRQGIRS